MPPTQSPTILTFDVSFSLTRSYDLKVFTPEQIVALYEAVGKVMSIKADAERN